MKEKEGDKLASLCKVQAEDKREDTGDDAQEQVGLDNAGRDKGAARSRPERLGQLLHLQSGDLSIRCSMGICEIPSDDNVLQTAQRAEMEEVGRPDNGHRAAADAAKKV